MRDHIPTLLRDAAADPSHTPDFDALAARGRRQHLAARAGTALVAVVALVAGGIVLWPDGQPARAPVIGEEPTTPNEAEQPVTLPDGWHEIEVGDATFGVPGDWVLEVFNEPAEFCVNGPQEPTTVVMHAGPVPETICPAPGMAARVLEAAPLSEIPLAWLDPPAGEQWRTTTARDQTGEVLVRDDHGTIVSYRFPTLNLWLQFHAPDPIGPWADEILSTLVASSGAVPNDEASPFDPAAQMRPDLMEVRPASAVPGDTVDLVFPKETPRGVAFVLEARSGERWDWRYVLTSSPSGSQREPAWWPADEHEGWEDLGVGGPGPDLVVIPDTASPGDYRICTANAVDAFCAPLRIDGEARDATPGPTESPTEAAYSCFGPPIPESVWATQKPAAGVEHPARSVLLDEVGPEGLDGWFLLEASEQRLAVAREREVVHETGDDMLRTHDVVAVRDFGGDTGWHLEQWSSCTPQLVHDQAGPASIWLDGEPDPNSQELNLLVVEMACVSGQSAEGRIEVLELEERQDAVEVVIGVRQLEGGFNCPSNPATPFTIQLQQPLGNRTIIDGSIYPPQPLDTAPSDLHRADAEAH